MAESKFLKYQDTDVNLLADHCDDIINTPAAKKCPSCTPSPNAPVPSWRTQAADDPWLNGKICMFQTTITTKETVLYPPNVSHTTPLAEDEYVAGIFLSYIEEAMSSLFFGFNKKDST